MSGAGRPGNRELVALAAILGVAALLRFWKLGDIPFGMHPDEGHNALDALRIADGWRPAFLPGNNGREALFMYLMSVAVAVAGPTIAAVRSTAAVCGVAAVAAQWLMVRGMGYTRAPRVALVSAALVAVGFWPVAQSRYGLRASLLPVWVALLVWAWWKVVSEGRIRLAPAVAAGTFIGLGVLTHLTGRILLLIPATSALGEFGARRGLRAVAAWTLAAVVAIAIAAPQLVFFLRQPEMVSYRSDQVSITNPQVNEGDLAGAVLENARRLVETPVLKGDGSWYHNIRHRPVFDIAVGIAFLAGAVLVIADLAGRAGATGRRRSLLLVAALGVTVLPSALSEGAPNYVRMTGAIPVLFLLPALALVAGTDWLDRQLARGLAWHEAPAGRDASVGLHAGNPTPVPSRTAEPTLRRTKSGTGTILLLGVLAVSAAWTARDYFLVYARAPQVYEAFNGAAVERGYLLSGLVGRTGGDGQLAATSAMTHSAAVYVTPALWNQSVIRFLNHERPPTSFDPRAGLVLPPSEAADERRPASETTAFYAFDPVEKDAVDAFAQQWPLAERNELTDSRGRPSLFVFELEPSEWRDAELRSLGVFGGAIRANALECRYVAGGLGTHGTIEVDLEWTALAPTPTDLNFFVRVHDEDGEIGQWDGPPLDGSYGTNEWAPGERILQTVLMPLNVPAPQSCTVSHGWYDWRDGKRLEVPGSTEDSVGSSWIR